MVFTIIFCLHSLLWYSFPRFFGCVWEFVHRGAGLGLSQLQRIERLGNHDRATVVVHHSYSRLAAHWRGEEAAGVVGHESGLRPVHQRQMVQLLWHPLGGSVRLGLLVHDRIVLSHLRLRAGKYCLLLYFQFWERNTCVSPTLQVLLIFHVSSSFSYALQFCLRRSSGSLLRGESFP